MSSDGETLKEKAQKVDQEIDEIKGLLDQNQISQNEAARRLDRVESQLDTVLHNYDLTEEDLQNLDQQTRDKLDQVYDDLYDIKQAIQEPSSTRRGWLRGLGLAGAGKIAGLGVLAGATADYINVLPEDYGCGDAWWRYETQPSGDIDFFGHDRWRQRQCEVPVKGGDGKVDGNGGASRTPTPDGETPEPSGRNRFNSDEWSAIVGSLEREDGWYVEKDRKVYDIGEVYTGMGRRLSESHPEGGAHLDAVTIELMGEEIISNVVPSDQTGANEGKDYTLDFFDAARHPELGLGDEGGIIRLSNYSNSPSKYGILETDMYAEAKNAAMEVRG